MPDLVKGEACGGKELSGQMRGWPGGIMFAPRCSALIMPPGVRQHHDFAVLHHRALSLESKMKDRNRKGKELRFSSS
ncbi:hypothetical protein ACI1P2_23175 [Paenibacillus sp. p-8]